MKADKVKPLRAGARWALVLSLFALAFGPPPTGVSTQALPPGDYASVVKVGGMARNYTVHVPRGFDGARALPVLLMFHGGGGSAKGAIDETSWGKKADEKGFFAVFPEGLTGDPERPASFLQNPQHWNDGSGRGQGGRKQFDDVGFANAVIDDMLARFGVDPKRIYVTGFSNGASMTFRVGAELSRRIAAIAPVSGHLWLDEVHLDAPVPLLYIIGTKDPLNPIEGGDARQPWGRRSQRKPPVRESLQRWARASGCGEEIKVVSEEDGVRTARVGGCKNGAEIVFVTVAGLGHVWPGGKNHLPEALVGPPSDKLDATTLIWSFLEKHRKK